MVAPKHDQAPRSPIRTRSRVREPQPYTTSTKPAPAQAHSGDHHRGHAPVQPPAPVPATATAPPPTASVPVPSTDPFSMQTTAPSLLPTTFPLCPAPVDEFSTSTKRTRRVPFADIQPPLRRLAQGAAFHQEQPPKPANASPKRSLADALPSPFAPSSPSRTTRPEPFGSPARPTAASLARERQNAEERNERLRSSVGHTRSSSSSSSPLLLGTRPPSSRPPTPHHQLPTTPAPAPAPAPAPGSPSSPKRTLGVPMSTQAFGTRFSHASPEDATVHQPSTRPATPPPPAGLTPNLYHQAHRTPGRSPAVAQLQLALSPRGGAPTQLPTGPLFGSPSRSQSASHALQHPAPKHATQQSTSTEAPRATAKSHKHRSQPALPQRSPIKTRLRTRAPPPPPAAAAASVPTTQPIQPIQSVQHPQQPTQPLVFKPSPGRAQRGVFLHPTDSDSSDGPSPLRSPTEEHHGRVTAGVEPSSIVPGTESTTPPMVPPGGQGKVPAKSESQRTRTKGKNGKKDRTPHVQPVQPVEAPKLPQEFTLSAEEPTEAGHAGPSIQASAATAQDVPTEPVQQDAVAGPKADDGPCTPESEHGPTVLGKKKVSERPKTPPPPTFGQVDVSMLDSTMIDDLEASSSATSHPLLLAPDAPEQREQREPSVSRSPRNSQVLGLALHPTSVNESSEPSEAPQPSTGDQSVLPISRPVRSTNDPQPDPTESEQPNASPARPPTPGQPLRRSGRLSGASLASRFSGTSIDDSMVSSFWASDDEAQDQDESIRLVQKSPVRSKLPDHSFVSHPTAQPLFHAPPSTPAPPQVPAPQPHSVPESELPEPKAQFTAAPAEPSVVPSDGKVAQAKAKPAVPSASGPQRTAPTQRTVSNQGITPGQRTVSNQRTAPPTASAPPRALSAQSGTQPPKRFPTSLPPPSVAGSKRRSVSPLQGEKTKQQKQSQPTSSTASNAVSKANSGLGTARRGTLGLGKGRPPLPRSGRPLPGRTFWGRPDAGKHALEQLGGLLSPQRPTHKQRAVSAQVQGSKSSEDTKASSTPTRRQTMQSLLGRDERGQVPQPIESEIEIMARKALEADADASKDASKEQERAAERKKARDAAIARQVHGYVPRKINSDLSGLSGEGSVDQSGTHGNVGSGGSASSDPNSSINLRAKRPLKRQLQPLRGLYIYVDVRDDDGTDSSAKWVDILRRLGARAVQKLTVSDLRFRLTHVVFKSGRPQTVDLLASLKDSPTRPKVVGVNWAAACDLEKVHKEEASYHVELEQYQFAKPKRNNNIPKTVPHRTSTSAKRS